MCFINIFLECYRHPARNFTGVFHGKLHAISRFQCIPQMVDLTGKHGVLPLNKGVSCRLIPGVTNFQRVVMVFSLCRSGLSNRDSCPTQQTGILGNSLSEHRIPHFKIIYLMFIFFLDNIKTSLFKPFLSFFKIPMEIRLCPICTQTAALMAESQEYPICRRVRGVPDRPRKDEDRQSFGSGGFRGDRSDR